MFSFYTLQFDIFESAYFEKEKLFTSRVTNAFVFT